MLRSPVRYSFGLIGLTFLAGALWAQKDPPPKPDPNVPLPKAGVGDYRDLFKKPETTIEYWKALNFEVDVGRYELAAQLLRGMLDSKPDETMLGAIADGDGLSRFLRLRNVPKWSDKPKEQAQAKKDVEELIGMASLALKKKIGTEDIINKHVRNLNAEPEKREFAVAQLLRIGPDAAPFLIEALIHGTEDQRANVLYALERLDRSVIAPLLAALDVDDPKIKTEIIGVLERRAETAAVPYLWHIAASPKNPEYLRNRAREVLGVLTQTDKSQLPSAKEMLTREAERYFQHQVRFPDPGAVTVWRWDGNKVVAGWPGATTVSTSQAEQHYGLRFARQALDLDPEYKPAQVVFLSLALEKAMERGGLDKSLAAADPQVHDLLTSVNPELVTAVLERGLADQNLPVIVGAARALGELNEGKAARPTATGDSALIRALNYPNRRVSFAAADALLRLPRIPVSDEARKPGVVPFAPAGRVVDVLRRAVGAEPVVGKARVLVVHNNVNVLDEIDKALKQAGYDPITVRTGKEALRRLNEASDVDAIMVDANMPDPLLPYFLGQVRSDLNSGLLPVLVLVTPDREVGLRRVTERYRNVHLVPPGFAIDVDVGLTKILPVLIAEAVGKPFSETEQREYTDRALAWLARIAGGEKKGYDARPVADTVIAALRSNKLSPEGAISAAQVLSRLPGEKPQQELASVIVEPNRPVPVRFVAAAELVRSLQENGVALPPGQVKLLHDLYNAPDTDPGLRSQVAVVLGSLRPDARNTGDRLKGFVPTPPQPPPTPMPPPIPPKDPDKEKKDPDKDK